MELLEVDPALLEDDLLEVDNERCWKMIWMQFLEVQVDGRSSYW